MASLAGGRDHGIAPNADLFLVKAKGAVRKNDGIGIATTAYNYESINWFLNGVEASIQARVGKDPAAKSVVSLSSGKNWRYAST